MAVETVRGLSASECPACWEELGEQRIPYSLTCGHTLCFTCIKRLGQNSPQFNCPLCRELVPLKSVKRNVTLYQLLSQLKGTVVGQSSFNPALTTLFDSIKLEQLLDRGASGEVHRGLWQDNEVAVKIFASGQLSPEIQDSFRREVCVMNSLRHPNVVLLLAACPDPPRLAIVMEYVGGGSLYSYLYIAKAPLVHQDAVKLLIDVGRGLQYLHSINILHRDLKSKNVLLTGVPPHCQAKLCDFGLARIRLESVTMTGNIGTVHWTAPEVLNCARYHFSADVYSLGMVMYEVIARSIPFGGLPPQAVIVAVLLRREKPRIPPGSDEVLSALVTRCLSWEPKDRPSVSSILQELHSLVTPPPQSDHDPTFTFDHTDSLGHVMVELEFGETDMDSDLMEFLLAAQGDGVEVVSGDNEQHVGEEEAEEEEAEEEKEDSGGIKDFDSPVGKGGVLSGEELQGFSSQLLSSGSYSSPIRSPIDQILEKNMAETDRLIPGGPAAQQAQVYANISRHQRRPKRSSQRVMPPSDEDLPDLSDYSTPFEMMQQFNPHQGRKGRSMEQYRLESGGLMDWAESIDDESQRKDTRRHGKERRDRKTLDQLFSTEEEDLKLAKAMQREELTKVTKSDYQLASRLQREYIDSKVPPITKPPPFPAPPPPALPLPQLPFRPTQRQLFMQQVSTLGRLKRLRPVQTVEKRGVRMGRVVDGTSSEDSNYTLQSEVQAFNKKLLSKVEPREPVYDVGRILPDQTKPIVKPMVARINSQVRKYNKGILHHVSLVEKNPLPTVEVIKSEKFFDNKGVSEPLPDMDDDNKTADYKQTSQYQSKELLNLGKEAAEPTLPEPPTETLGGKKQKSGALATKKKGSVDLKETNKKHEPSKSSFSKLKASTKTTKYSNPIVSPSKTTAAPLSHTKSDPMKGPSKLPSVPKGASDRTKSPIKTAADLHTTESSAATTGSQTQEMSSSKMKQSKKRKKI